MKASRLRSVSVTTSWVALPDNKAEKVSILNSTGADLEIRHAGDPANPITLSDGLSIGLSVSATSAEIEIQAAAGASGVQIVID